MKRIAMVFLVLLLVGAVVAAGCGNKSAKPKAATGSAEDVLAKAQDSMKEVKSFKLKGDALVETPEAETKEESFEFTAEANVISEDETDMHVVAKDSTGQVTDAYMVGGYAYTNDPVSGWVKQPISGNNLTSGVVTPGTIQDLDKFAENMAVKEEQGKYVLTFDLGSAFFDDMFKQSAGEEPAATSPAEEEALKQLEDTMKELMKGLEMSMSVTIDKDTYYMDSFVITASMKGAPMMGDMNMEMNGTFSDYNVPVTVALPPEAQAAREVPPGPGGVFDIPGLGI